MLPLLIAAAGTAASLYGGDRAAKAAEEAAAAQAEAARKWQSYVQGETSKATDLALSPANLAAYDTTLKSQERNVLRQETLVKSLDPALIEAGKQAKDLLDGKSAPVMDNLKQQRQTQRTQLLDTLRQQLGPGAETSSAGMQALSKFDTETSNILSGAQQDYLKQVSGMSLAGLASGQSLSQVNETLGQVLSKYNPGQTMADIASKYATQSNGANQAVVNAAGGEFKGDQLRGQMLSNLGGAMIQGAAAYAGGQRAGGTDVSKSGVGDTSMISGTDLQAPSNSMGSNFSVDNPSGASSAMSMGAGGGSTLGQVLRKPKYNIPYALNPDANASGGMISDPGLGR